MKSWLLVLRPRVRARELLGPVVWASHLCTILLSLLRDFYALQRIKKTFQGIPDVYHCSAGIHQENISRLIECLDVDNGLADCLFSRRVLSLEQYERLTNKSFLPSSQEQNRELLTNMLPSRLKSISACKMFMAALVETDQRHIFNFIMDSRGVLSDVQCFPTIMQTLYSGVAMHLSRIEDEGWQWRSLGLAKGMATWPNLFARKREICFRFFCGFFGTKCA